MLTVGDRSLSVVLCTLRKKGKTFLRWYIIFGCASDLLMSAKAVYLNTTDLEQMLSAL